MVQEERHMWRRCQSGGIESHAHRTQTGSYIGYKPVTRQHIVQRSGSDAVNARDECRRGDSVAEYLVCGPWTSPEVFSPRRRNVRARLHQIISRQGDGIISCRIPNSTRVIEKPSRRCARQFSGVGRNGAPLREAQLYGIHHDYGMFFSDH
jgi:hypothetical protein